MSPRIFILSPHSCDAAYSLTLHIAAMVKRKWQLTFINCFSVNEAFANGIEVKLVEASHLTDQHDGDFNVLLGPAIRFINLNLPGGQVRHGEEVSFDKPFDRNEWVLVQQLQNLLEDIVNSEDDLLFCPLGVGGDIDHVVCREAVVELYPEFKVIFYRDMPHGDHTRQPDLEKHLHLLGQRLDAPLQSDIYNASVYEVDKRSAVRLYQNGFTETECNNVLKYLDKKEDERIWAEPAHLEELRKMLFV